ncbi:MAG: nuclear transport factor 2 family protein [Myxococcota bacterium]
MSESRSGAALERDNLALIDRYFEAVAAGDPEIGALFTDDVVWRTPQSSPLPGPWVGRAAVLAGMGSGIGLYQAGSLDIRPVARAASADRVFVEMTLRATTAAGAPYRNQYVFVFTIRDDRIAEVHEHLDTHYAQRRLFDPAGRASPLDE